MRKEQFTSETPWTSLYIIACLTFFAMVQFSIYFSSTYPFLLSLDPNISEKFYGLVVASYSLGQIIGSPLIGYYSNKLSLNDIVFR
ncbi:MFS domain-containing protein [Aphelenchoides bicaudatus]|nr:MFS domain-containing protein [Aphelenchoides bicaudatus]